MYAGAVYHILLHIQAVNLHRVFSCAILLLKGTGLIDFGLRQCFLLLGSPIAVCSAPFGRPFCCRFGGNIALIN